MLKVIPPLQSYLRSTVYPRIPLRLPNTAPRVKTEFPSRTSNLSLPPYHRSFSSSTFAKMSDLTVELTAPNGRKYIQPTGLFINNEWVKSSTGQKITSINPSDESEIASVYAASAEDVDAAVKAARAAMRNPEWRDLSPTDRGSLMIKLSSIITEHTDILATIETWDNGKIYCDALADVAEVEAVFKYYGGYADKIHGQVIDTGIAKFAYTLKEPIGVCGQIIPWNYPFGIAAWKLGPALACGNAVEAGFPPGVVNIINGYGREAGTAIATHPNIDKVTFTGSTATGKEIMKMAASTMKNITLETGGKSPLLVFEDADLDQAVKWAHLGVMSNQGQICTATSRILVQDSIFDQFVDAFKKQLKEVSVLGDPFDETTFQGPQVTKAQYERVLGYVQTGKDEGATLISGGEAYTKVHPSGKGFFVTPVVFTGVNPSMRIYREEIFGPFGVIASFKTEDEGIEMANDTTYGLGGAIFTTNLDRAHKLARRIESGTVWINSSQDSDFRIPFGGKKMSGIGRELGEEGLQGYTSTKAIHVNLGVKL
ncbi:hypothetical protein DID88_008126 [Monilinia fructigena]|uniref:aldehyde dehydrogenase (NAD(+)) n=1 Tax=Monilinia fructigena TaxID=38457 RepID=A0A395J4U7_9HELO|nr:hypothetical protein DID88_008126 [Monilinia fructigena]